MATQPSSCSESISGKRAIERGAERGAIFRRRAIDPDLEERGDDAIAGLEARDMGADGDHFACAIGARDCVVVQAVAIFARDDGVVAVIQRGGA